MAQTRRRAPAQGPTATAQIARPETVHMLQTTERRRQTSMSCRRYGGCRPGARCAEHRGDPELFGPIAWRVLADLAGRAA